MNLASGTTFTVEDFFLNSVAQPVGLYTAANDPTLISGAGTLDVLAQVPEPGSIVALVGLCGMGFLGLVLHRRRTAKIFSGLSLIRLVVGSVGALAIAASSGALSAATITADGSLIGHNSIPQPGSDGYVLFQAEPTSLLNGGGGNAGTNVGTLPSYVSVDTTGDSFFASGSGYGYTTLTASGTAYKTGIAYQVPGNGNTATLATITLKAGTPDDFQLGVFTNNTDNTANIASAVTVASPEGNSVTENTVLHSTSNDFYLFDIVGKAGDTITVSLTQSGGAADPLGGLTFTTVPEPASIVALAGLCGMGLIGLVLRRGAALRKGRLWSLRVERDRRIGTSV